MGFLENNLEEIIYNNPDGVRNRGLNIYNHAHVSRQLRLGNYGVADLVGFDIEPNLYGEKLIVTVYELKKDAVDFKTLAQALRYVTGISRLFDIFWGMPSVTEFNICLIGKKVSHEYDLLSFMGNMGTLHAFTYEYCLDGIKFKNESNYRLTAEAFPESTEYLHVKLLDLMAELKGGTHPEFHPFAEHQDQIPF